MEVHVEVHLRFHVRTDASMHTRTHARVINCTNYTGGRKHRFYLALSMYLTFGTIFSGYRGFRIKRNIPIESWIMRNWRRLVWIFENGKEMGVRSVLFSPFYQILSSPLTVYAEQNNRLMKKMTYPTPILHVLSTCRYKFYFLKVR